VPAARRAPGHDIEDRIMGRGTRSIALLSALALFWTASCSSESSVAPSQSVSASAGVSMSIGVPSAAASPTSTTIESPRASLTPATPASGGKVVFSRHDLQTDDTFCFTIDPDGSNEARTHSGACGPPSPDGRKILITVYQPSGFGPLVGGRPATTNPDGSGFTVLDSYPKRQISLTCRYWSPDGRRLLCESGGDGMFTDDGIYTMRSSDGGDLVRLTRAPKDHEDQPQGYSPDGSRILFERVSDVEPSAEYIVNADGTGLVRLSASDLWAADFVLGADWSPDGSAVAFVAAVESGGHPGLYVVNADGTGLRQIVTPDVGGLTARWSPDGRWIASSTCLRCGPQVFLIHPDGTGRVALTDGSDGSTSLTPVWSPDGSWLLYQTQQADGRVTLWTMRPDGSDRSRVADAGTDLSDVAWGAVAAP
jgi:WD40-like Beta Propeller Repeat